MNNFNIWFIIAVFFYGTANGLLVNQMLINPTVLNSPIPEYLKFPISIINIIGGIFMIIAIIVKRHE